MLLGIICILSILNSYKLDYFRKYIRMFYRQMRFNLLSMLLDHSISSLDRGWVLLMLHWGGYLAAI